MCTGGEAATALSPRLSSPSFLLQLALAVVVSVSVTCSSITSYIVVGCEGVTTVPAMITTGVTTCYYSEDCQTGTGSNALRLFTETMYSNSTPAPAYFYTEGLNIRGRITFFLPWTAAVIAPFTAVFVNSYSSYSVSVATFVLYGHMSYGSNITIVGGTHASTRADGLTSMVQITNHLYLRSGSVIVVKNVDVIDYLNIFSTASGKVFSIESSSHFEFTNTTLSVTHDHTADQPVRSIVALYQLTLSNSSTFIINNSTVIVQRSMRNAQFTTLYIEDASTVSNNCTLLLSSNIVQIDGFSHITAIIVSILISGSTLTISASSVLSVRSNQILATSLQTSANRYSFLFNLNTLIIQGYSKVLVDGNTLINRDNSGTYTTQIILQVTLSIIIESNGSLMEMNNVMSSQFCTVSVSGFFFGFRTAETRVVEGGTLTVNNNVMHITNETVSSEFKIILFSSGNTALEHNSLMNVSNNVVSGTHVNGPVTPTVMTSELIAATTTVLSSSSQFIVRRNNLAVVQNAPLASVGTISILDENGGLAAFCDNTVNNRLCRGQDCLTVSGGNATVMGCTSTQTLPAEFVPTPTIHHNSTTLSPRQTPSPTKRPTPSSATLTSSLLRVPTTTQTLPAEFVPTPTVHHNSTTLPRTESALTISSIPTLHTTSPTVLITPTRSSPQSPPTTGLTTLTAAASSQPTQSHSHSISTTSPPPTSSPPPPTTTTTTTTTPCNYSCTDIISFLHLASNVQSPQQAIDAYIATSNIMLNPTTISTGWHGCTYMTIPFTATANGDIARVLIHVASPLPKWNASTSPDDRKLATTRTGALSANGVLSTDLQTQGGSSVVVVDVRRVDANPMVDVSGSIVLPLLGMACVVDVANSAPHGGLPWANINLAAPPPSLTDGERTAVAVVAVTSADLQTIAAIGMLRCSPGSDMDVESEAGIRALVPMALSATCAGAVQGALLAVGVSGVLSVLAMSVAKNVKHLSWVEAAAMTRCPGIVITVWAFMQMGLVVCGSRLVTSDGGDNVVLGVVGIAAGMLLPVVCIGLAWGVVSRRCYRLAQLPGAVAGRHSIVVWARSVLLPSFEVDAATYPISKAFSSVVGRTRRPSCVWAGLPVSQPIIMLIVVFVQGESCSLSLIITGVIMMLMGALCHVFLRPHRILNSNFLQGVAMALNAAVFFIASKLVGDPLNITAINANGAIAMIQVALSVCRLVHTMGYLVYMHLYRGDVLAVCSVDVTGTTIPASQERQGGALPTPSPCTPVFDVQGRFCFNGTTTTPTEMDVPLMAAPVVIGGHLLPITPTPSHQNIGATTTPSPTTNNNNQSLTDAKRQPPTRTTPSPSPQSKAPPHTITTTTAVPNMPRKASRQDTSKKQLPVAKSDNNNNKRGVEERETTRAFLWDPKGYVPMERPYTMLYEEEDDGYDDDDTHIPDARHSISQEMDPIINLDSSSDISRSSSNIISVDSQDGVIL